MELLNLQKRIRDNEYRIDAGGCEFDDAVKMAKENHMLRLQLRRLIAERTEIESNTVEGKADQAMFNYLVAACLVYNDTKRPVFSSKEDYEEKAGSEQGAQGASKLAELVYELDDDYESKYAENRFLREFGLADEQNRYINEEGKLVNADGELVDEQNRRINEQNQLIDGEGRPIDENNNFIVERKPFTKGGKPITSPSDKPKRGRKPTTEE